MRNGLRSRRLRGGRWGDGKSGENFPAPSWLGPTSRLNFKRAFCHPNCHPIIRNWVAIHRTERDTQRKITRQINLR